MRFGITKSWGMILLAVWLILSGLIPLLSIHIDRSGTFMNVLGDTRPPCRQPPVESTASSR
jgi:hypothetical protein